jgi:prophage antirepressor-like protein
MQKVTADSNGSEFLPEIFRFKGQRVRTFIKDGEPWFVAKDVCYVLEVINVSQALSRLEEDEKDGICLNDTVGRVNTASIVNEYGLYSLVMSSRKPEAREFKRWVTHEVIPSIRKTGSYIVPQISPVKMIHTLSEAMLEIEEKNKERDQKIAELQIETKEIRDTLAPKASRYEQFLNSQNTFSFLEVAKVIGAKDMGRTRLMKFLRDKRVISKGNGKYNLPYQQFMEAGYFEVLWKEVDFADGQIPVTVVTPKGVNYIYRLLKKDGRLTA